MNCRIKDNRSILVFEEKGRKLTLTNRNSLETIRIKVDGCEINDHSMRCDFMLIINDLHQDIYIELKGTDLSRAKEQILATKQKLGSNTESKAYIVCSRVPKSGTDNQNIKRELRRNKIESIIYSGQGSDKF